MNLDFVVTEKRKEIWNVELDLLNKLIEVCSKYNLKVFAIGGTLLGAVRHHGFIPWDDDIDLIMLREDYIKLCQIAGKEFKNPYFFQNTYTDKIYRVHSQLRNSNTTALLKNEYASSYNHGIFIDIFVLDNLPDDKKKIDKIKKVNKKYTKTIKYINVNKFSSPNFIKRTVGNILLPFYKLMILPFGGRKKIFKRYENKIASFCSVSSSKLCNVTFDNIDKDVFDKKWFDEVVYLDFEGLKMPCPKNYDEVLRVEYGANYMTPIMASSKHGETYFDVNNSYTKYKDLKLKEYLNLFNDLDY